MAVVSRLLTLVDIVDADDEQNPRRMSVSALHKAELDDGRRVVLLDDRGWISQLSGAVPDRPVAGWAFETAEELEREARDVVGPDEPVSGVTRAETEAGHWATLAGILREHGVEVDASVLRSVPHDVELSARLRARVCRASDDTDKPVWRE